MIYLKVFGSLLVITSTTFIGFILGSNFKNRYHNLIYLENCIRLLETEIIYHLNPIPIALENVYLKGNKNVSFIFKEIKDKLINRNEVDLSDCFNEVLNKYKQNLNLLNTDLEILKSLGNILGLTDRNDQLKHIKSSLILIKNSQKDAELKMKKNEVMYKRLGFLTGLLVIIILL